MKEEQNDNPIQSAIDHQKMNFIEFYSRNREEMNMRDSLAKLYDDYIGPLQARIQELEGKQTFTLKDLDAAFVAGRSKMSWEQFKKEALKMAI